MENVFKEVYAYRAMVDSLVRRDLRGRYKGSVLGFLWTFINPLLQLAVYTLIFSIIMRNNNPTYFLFLFVALIPWLFFSNCVSRGCNAVSEQKSLVTKVYFPREVLPLSFVTAGFINMLYCFVIVLAVVGGTVLVNSLQQGQMAVMDATVYSGAFSFLPMLSLPLIMLIEYALCLGFTFFLSGITVYFRDMEHIMGIIQMLWFYCTPVLYNVDQLLDGTSYEGIKWLFLLNPMTTIANGYHSILYYGTWPDFSTLWISVVWAIAMLFIGFFTFQGCKRRFAEEL